MTKFTNRKEIRYVCGNRLGFHIFIISACSRNVKYILTKIRSYARQLFARCRGRAVPSRRRTCSPYKPPSKWLTPPNCHCEAPKGPWQSRSTRTDNGRTVGEIAAACPRLPRDHRRCILSVSMALRERRCRHNCCTLF